MRKANLEPAYSIIRKLGGDAAVAEICGLDDRTSPYRWTRPRELKGSGGLVPAKYVGKLLAHARAKKIKLTADDFVPKS